MRKAAVGLVGSGFISTIHAEALRRVAAAEIIRRWSISLSVS